MKPETPITLSALMAMARLSGLRTAATPPAFAVTGANLDSRMGSLAITEETKTLPAKEERSEKYPAGRLVFRKGFVSIISWLSSVPHDRSAFATTTPWVSMGAAAFFWPFCCSQLMTKTVATKARNMAIPNVINDLYFAIFYLH